MLNSEHFSKIQKALDATAFRLEEAGAEFGQFRHDTRTGRT